MKLLILCDRPRQARKVGKRCVGGESQNHQDRTNGEVVEPAVAHHRAGQHRQHALVAGPGGIGGGNVVSAAQNRNADQKNRQQHDDDGQGDLGVFARGIAERHHPVADRFHAGHGRAA
jgi:hypothetical protein